MSVEPKRGCGYRKIGALYLASNPGGSRCDRLPFPLTVCPTCSHGFKHSRGFTWVDVDALVGGVHQGCKDRTFCPLCKATADMGKAGLIWVGAQFYKTPDDFEQEAKTLGISRRIHVIPRQFVVGKTWVLLAHRKGIKQACPDCAGKGWIPEKADVTPTFATAMECPKCEGHATVNVPAIFKVWRPDRVEKILAESQRGSAEHKSLEEKGIVCVFVPGDDLDHQGSVYEDDTEDDAE